MGMSRITSLDIEAYRSLRNVKLDELRSVNLLVGGNNAGKTSILEAVGLIARPLDPAQWIQTVTNREPGGSVLDGLWGMFPNSKVVDVGTSEHTAIPIIIRAHTSEDTRSLSVDAAVYPEQWADVEQAARAEVQTEALMQLDVNASTNDRFIPMQMDFHSGKPRRIFIDKEFPSIRIFSITNVSHRSTEQLIRYLSRVINTGAKEQLIKLLQLFDAAVRDVMISRAIDRDAIRVAHEDRGIVDLSTFGDGMRRAFAMSNALLMAGGGILLIDEIESALHARALDSLFPWLISAAKAADVQIVATTHSLDAIDAVISSFHDEPDGLASYYLRKSNTGTFCSRYDLSSLRNLRSEGLDIR
jgi:AAA15 family ATPase/GTPase